MMGESALSAEDATEDCPIVTGTVDYVQASSGLVRLAEYGCLCFLAGACMVKKAEKR